MHREMEFEVLEQGCLPLPAEPLAPLVDAPLPRFPPVVQQAMDHMAMLGEETVLLTRVGGFYELYFGQAERWAEVLGLRVGWKKTLGGPVAMAGFPFFQLERFLKMLVVGEGRQVAICEEFPVPTGGREDKVVLAEGGKLWERKIARIVTPGTLIDEEWVEKGENHFLLAVEVDGGMVGLAWADLGTGEVWCQVCEPAETLAAEIGRIAPREVVGDADAVAVVRELAKGLGGPGFTITPHDMDGGRGAIAIEFAAAKRLADYVESRLPGMKMALQEPVRKNSWDSMGIDVNSMRGLEIKATLRDNVSKGSLLHTVNRTVSKGGKRLLGNWLCAYSLASSLAAC